MNPFHEWIANTVLELGGNRSACLQYLQRKHALTSAATRMVDVSSFFFDVENVDSMRCATEVDTNLKVLH